MASATAAAPAREIERTIGAAVAQAGFQVADAQGIVAGPDGLFVAQSDAFLRLAARHSLGPGLYEVDIAFGDGRSPDVVFEFEYTGGAGPQIRAVPVNYSGRGHYRSLCQVPDRLTAVVMHPNAPGERLAIERFRVRRLSTVARIWLLASRALELLVQDPRALVGAFRRYRAGVTRGDVIVSRRGVGTKAGTYDAWIAKFDDQPENEEALYRDRLARAGPLPSLSVFVLVEAFSPGKIARMIESFRLQFHRNWELLLIAGAELKPQLAELAASGPETDARIRLLVGQPGDEPAAGLNDALVHASGDWLFTLDVGDVLRPHALAELALAIARHPGLACVYADEDTLDLQGNRREPYFKPDWSPDLLRSWNYLGRPVAFRTETVREADGWRASFGPVRHYDLNLRVTEALAPQTIHHVPKILLHAERSHAPELAASPAPSIAQATVRCVAEHLERTGRRAAVELVPGRSVVRLRYALPDPPPLVSIIVPTRDRADLLTRCVQSLLAKTTYAPFELILVDNNSTDPQALARISELTRDQRVRVLCYPGAFNFSAINNLAVNEANGEVLALVNNDIEVMTPDWLHEMAAHALRPEIGCVGAKLTYPDGTLQHAGIILGLGGLAAHAHKRLQGSDAGYFGRAACVCNVSAVTAACLVVRRSLYEEVGGLDAGELAVAFNDVDFCLKVRERGYLNLWTPFAEHIHHESASRGSEASSAQAQRFAREINVMKQRWGIALRRDPFYSPHLTLLREDYSIRP